MKTLEENLLDGAPREASNSINDSPPEDEHIGRQSILNSNDILINQKLMDDIVIPSATRDKVIAKWNSESRRYELPAEAMTELAEDQDLRELWEKTTNEIYMDQRLRPFECQIPFWLTLMWLLIRAFITLTVLFFSFELIQVFLFNFIMIGFLIWFNVKTLSFSKGFYKNRIYDYKTKSFINFIRE